MYIPVMPVVAMNDDNLSDGKLYIRDGELFFKMYPRQRGKKVKQVYDYACECSHWRYGTIQMFNMDLIFDNGKWWDLSGDKPRGSTNQYLEFSFENGEWDLDEIVGLERY